jgi:hypothetical protein
MKPSNAPQSNSAILFSLALCASLAAADRASAGPVEQLVEIVFAPGEGKTMIARYLNGGGGLLYSDDDGATWQMQCGSAMAGAGSALTGPTAILDDGSVVARTSAGLFIGDSRGCAFKNEGEQVGTHITDFALHPSEPNVLYATRGDRMDPSKNGVVRRNADGSWTDLSVQPERMPVSLRATRRGDQTRLFTLALKLLPPGMTAAAPEYLIQVSDDEGKTWQEHALIVADGTPRMRGADPSNPDRLVIVTARTSAPDDVLVSLDSGATTSVYQQVTDFGGVTFAADGRVWIGDLGGSPGSNGMGQKPGLFAAASLAEPAAALPMAHYPVQCVGFRESDSRLIACQRFWMGDVDVESGAFTTSLRMTEVDQFVSCGDDVDLAAQCEQQLCADYCGAAHFAVAPVCAAYDTPTCGLPVAREEAGMFGSDGGTATGAGGAGGTTSAAGGSAIAAGSGAIAGSAGASQPPSAAAGGEAKGGDMPSSSGCAVGPAPRGAPGSGPFAWLALVALGLVGGSARARRRRHLRD